MSQLKVLYYNWADLEDAAQRGGGVSVYQRNLAAAALRRGDAVWFLSSGISHTPLWRRPFIRKRRAGVAGVREHELVNSAILSPGQQAFGQPADSAPEMEAVFADFLRRHGPFDVVHFNNLEGIPVSFLRLAREHSPRCRAVYSVHNYFAFCPQVNLWFQEEHCCRDFRDGRKCVNCLVKPVNARGARRIYQADYYLRKFGIRPPGRLHTALSWLLHYPLRLCYRGLLDGLRTALSGAGVALGLRRPTEPTSAKTGVILDADKAARFAERRGHFVEALNAHADRVLAVSHRVAELVTGFGIDPARVQTLYIGTRFARPGGGPCKLPSPDGVLRLAYLGYMRRDKGFYFFLDALRKMPAGLARRLGVVFACKVTDLYAYERIRRMAHRFAEVRFHDGYTHAQLPRILAGVDLGVVPVLWEDNLPQVAIECVASGVPVLTSDRGGARELLDCPELVFKAGSRPDFYARLRAVLANPGLLRTAMAGRLRLDSPEEHYDRLRREVYCAARAPAAGGGRAACPRGIMTVEPGATRPG
jgi:glycosyltransferase involved in cell wall biosynthesis